jgi:hypothetical protein
MTAKELKQAVYESSERELYTFTHNEMQTFIEQLCEEQREICGEIVFNSDAADEVYASVMLAPIPEI